MLGFVEQPNNLQFSILIINLELLDVVEDLNDFEDVSLSDGV